MSIKAKLIILFLAIAVIPLAFVSALTFHNYQDSMKTIRLSDLQQVVAFKADKIGTYFSGLKTHIEIAQGFYNIKKNLPVLVRMAHHAADPGFLAAKRELDEQLKRMQSVLNLADIMLVDPEGKVVYTSNSDHWQKHFLNFLPNNQQKTFKQNRAQVGFSDIFLNKTDDNKPAMLVTAPLFDFNGIFIGGIVFDVDMAPVYKLIRDTAGLGRTGETLIGKKMGDEVIFLNPLKYEPQAALTKRLSMGGIFGGPIQKAVRGENGAGELIDYRGTPVIAVWRYLPTLQWGMVAKIDAREAFADINRLRNLVIMILVIISGLAGVTAFSIAQSIFLPIQRLSKGAEIIGKGNLDHKVGTVLKDEVGHLSRSFDQMTENLKTVMASRNELNKEIVERKAAEEDLRRSNESLEQFAYVASHDLQEPLRIMSSYSQLLEKRYKDQLDQDANEFIDFIVDAAKRMQKLITDLLAYSRVGRKDIPATEEDLNQVLRKVLEGMSMALESSGGTVTYDRLPVLTIHETSIMQVFQNLIGNALKFHGEMPPRIHISAKKEGNTWVFSVQDNGLGIEPRYHERIFQIFQRLHAKEEYSGTGIGLSICKKIVTNYGGKIWVESPPKDGSPTQSMTDPSGNLADVQGSVAEEHGKGSTFYFTLPTERTENG